jgi:hypothetical protein
MFDLFHKSSLMCTPKFCCTACLARTTAPCGDPFAHLSRVGVVGCRKTVKVTPLAFNSQQHQQ